MNLIDFILKKKKFPPSPNYFGIWASFFKLKTACHNCNQFPLLLSNYSAPIDH